MIEFKKQLTTQEADRLAKMSLVGTIIGVFLSGGLFSMPLLVASYFSAYRASKNRDRVPKMATAAKTIIYIWIIILIGAFLENYKNK